MAERTAAGKYIFDELVKRKLTLAELAKAAGMPRRELEQVVLGMASPDEETTARIDAALATFDAPKS